LNKTLSNVTFGIGLVLAISALVAIFITSISLENTNKPTNSSNPTNPNPTNGIITSINIPLGSSNPNAAQFYDPNPAKVSNGSKITWINNDNAPHTATAVDESFDTNIIQRNSNGSAIVKGERNISYSCTIHPYMKGTLIIVG
jgi:plastocyanin